MQLYCWSECRSNPDWGTALLNEALGYSKYVIRQIVLVFATAMELLATKMELLKVL